MYLKYICIKNNSKWENISHAEEFQVIPGEHPPPCHKGEPPPVVLQRGLSLGVLPERTGWEEEKKEMTSPTSGCSGHVAP